MRRCGRNRRRGTGRSSALAARPLSTPDGPTAIPPPRRSPGRRCHRGRRVRCGRGCFHEPIDGVVGIGALIDVIRPRMGRELRAHFEECAFALETAAHILDNEDVAGAGERRGRAEVGRIAVLAVRPGAIGGARQQNRIGSRGEPRCVDLREQVHPSRMAMRKSCRS